MERIHYYMNPDATMKSMYYLNDKTTGNPISVLKSFHPGTNAGFFSHCSCLLEQIIWFVYFKQHLPDYIDSSVQFDLYKYDETINIMSDFFECYHNESPSTLKYPYNKSYCIWVLQLSDYRNIDYEYISPYVEKYFSPSPVISRNIDMLLEKYNIDPENTIGIHYRGTDKYKETPLGDYQTYLDKLNMILNTECNEHMKVLVRTDQTQFLDYFKENVDNDKLIIITDITTSSTDVGIHFQKSIRDNYDHMMFLIPTFMILARCNHLITGSGNCGIWLALFRKSGYNLHQFLEDKWL